MMKIVLSKSSIGVSFCPSSHNTQSSPPSHLGNIIKSLTEVKYDDEVPAHIGDEDSFSPLVIDGVYKLVT